MRATRRLLYKGFLARSFDEAKRLGSIICNLEGIKGPKGPRELFRFDSPAALADCKPLSDEGIGGYSTVHLDWVPHRELDHQDPQHLRKPGGPPPIVPPKGYARIHGTISTRLPQRPDVIRSGFAGFRTRDRPPTLFGRALWDLDPYVYLALRVRLPTRTFDDPSVRIAPRSWFVNIQTDSIVATDLHQHRLWLDPRAPPGSWQTVLIRLNDFVRTNYGLPVEPATEMLKQKVRTVGLALTDGLEERYELHVERVWATSLKGDEEVMRGREEERQWAGTQARDGVEVKGEEPLKNRKGERIAWAAEGTAKQGVTLSRTSCGPDF